MKKLSKVVALALATTFLFTACGSKTGEKKKEEKKVGVQDQLVIENEGTPVKDATLKIAYISDSPFTGIFHQAFASGNPDMEILTYSTNGAFAVDENYKLINGGGANIEFLPKERK